MANVYDYRAGRAIKNVPAQTIGETVDQLKTANGVAKSEDLLALATDPTSPLHQGFEWDDTVAARKHRLRQAGLMIASIRVVNSPVLPPSAPAFISVRTVEHGRGFLPAVEALTPEVLRQRAKDDIARAIEGLKRRYRLYEDICDLLDGMKGQVA